ncbi:hypothetical protein Golomagni_03237 [Golovinomyces magnicellulatus]|nr:hypothetical protein Golomagni_03237 [Golovinomyces magnicellulatus]
MVRESSRASTKSTAHKDYKQYSMQLCGIDSLNEAIMLLNKSLQVTIYPFTSVCKKKLTSLQEINIQNMNAELVAQMFKNYQSNVLFHLEGLISCIIILQKSKLTQVATDSLKDPA